MMTPNEPALHTAAPAKAPTRACEELVGSPSHHVMRSQMIAPTSAARTTYVVTTLISTIPAPTVLATAVPKPKTATKLKNAAQITACKGVRTRVETTVAIELAASWKPLKKSKTNAMQTTIMIRVTWLYAYLTTTPSIKFATCSHLSMASSISESISFSLIS